MKNIYIPITNHNDQCQQEYRVEYKVTGDTGYTVAPPWYAAPPIRISNLLDGTQYDVRITRICCDGQVSEPLELTVATGLMPPEDFVATGYLGEVELTWTDNPIADNFVIDRDTSDTFPSPTEIYNGIYIASVIDTPLAPDTYYYRIRAVAAGFDDSDYSYANATST